MATVTRSPKQQMDALEIANAVRMDRARLKGQIGALSYHNGLVLVAALLRQAPGDLGSMKVIDLVVSIRKMGPAKARCVFSRAGGRMAVDPWARLDDLSPSRCAALAAELERIAGRAS